MLYDKEIYIEMAHAYNKNVRTDKDYSITHAYNEVLHTEWPYGNIYDKQYAPAIRNFLDTIHAAGIYLHCPIMAPENELIELQLYPHAAPTLRAIGAESCKNILPLTDKKKVAYHEIAVHGEWIYATDGYAMVKIRDVRWTAFDGKTIPYSLLRDIREGKELVDLKSVKHPYEKVLQHKRKVEAKCNCSIQALVECAYGACLVSKDINTVISSLRLTFDEQVSCYLRPDHLYHVLRILQANGAQQVELRSAEEILELRADNGNTGLVMQHPPYNMNYPRLIINGIKVSSCKIKKNRRTMGANSLSVRHPQ